MATTKVQSSNWRLVEVGRIVLINDGADAGKRAAVVEIIDHKRALVDGPEVSRQSVILSHVTLTNQVVPNIPRGAGTTAVVKKWKASDVDAKWAASSWAKKIARRERRRQLTDFERFQVLILKKQRRYVVRKAVAKA